MAARLLKLGLQGTDVKELQQSLQQVGYKLAIDGKFGRETLSAVANFQSWWGLGIDGVVGPKTRAAIQQAVEGKRPSKKAKPPTRGTATAQSGGSPETWIITEWFIIELAAADEYEEWAEYELYADGWEDLEDDAEAGGDDDEDDDDEDDDAKDDDEGEDDDDAKDEKDDDEAEGEDDAEKDDDEDEDDAEKDDEAEDDAEKDDDEAEKDEGEDDAGGDEGGGDEGGGDEGGGGEGGGGDEDE
jgi:hypothetical protein